MRKNISAIILSILLIVPIFYVALCILFDLPITSSFNVLNELYTQSYILERALKVQVYIAAAYSILPFLFTIMTIIAKWKKSIYGYAAFATIETIKKMELNFKKGFTLCLFKGKTTKTEDTRSTLVVAAPGTGKTSGVIVPNLLTIKTSAIVLDIKGEIEALTSEYRRKVFKNEILILNPFGSDNNFHFNPFDKDVIKGIIKDRRASANPIDLDENFDFSIKMEIVKRLSNLLFKENKNEDPYWKKSARTLFILFAMYDIEKRGSTDFYRLMRYPRMAREELLNDEVFEKAQEHEETEEIKLDDLKLFFNQVENDLSINVMLRDTARAVQKMNQKEFNSCLNMYATALEVFTDYRVKKVVESMSFKYEDLRKKNITIYLKLLEDDIETLSPLINIFLETVGRSLLRKENNDPNQRIDFYLDEFVRFGRNPFILELPGLSRSYNIPSTFVVQTSSQVKKHYSLEDLEIISATCVYNIIFTISDFNYAKMISESIGNLTRNKESNTSQFSKAFGSTNKSDEGYALLTPQDLMNIPKNEVIISVFGHKATPIKGKINYYFKNRSLKKIIKKYSKKEK